MTWRTTALDRPSVMVTADPGWLLAPLAFRALAGLPEDDPGALIDGPVRATAPTGGAPVSPGPAIAAGFDAWWSTALEHDPRRAAPAIRTIVADTGLAEAWAAAGPAVQAWMAEHPARRLPHSAESAVLQDLRATGFRPGWRTVHLLVIPVHGDWYRVTAPGRVVLSPAVRAAPGWPDQLRDLARRET
ncbi:hypothetical protein GIS00_07085 [Nakamurella sp. YIM 132087]|uniref:Uncharacterized protein n=1 Tax=Nakamurella alba TaxID=2665158 RepID=A0A7K1FI09_9ACTN|nr:hypothetical protein [Nakamurella alba]MTD13706.1 hypothetical protein [Nakamurella alba]